MNPDIPLPWRASFAAYTAPVVPYPIDRARCRQFGIVSPVPLSLFRDLPEPVRAHLMRRMRRATRSPSRNHWSH
ncbi:MAG: hypothetical protein OJF60_002188 [Burkholderiaceae bacterium]|jgi:hypothetical protein|nr:MAG: hypothetical protein OJF60_002188 [Burkholderiaceae bacterium]